MPKQDLAEQTSPLAKARDRTATHNARMGEPIIARYNTIDGAVSQARFNVLPIKNKFALSAEAIEGLKAKCHILKCGPTLPACIATLPAHPELYADSRPIEMRELDEPLLEADRFPTWDWEYDRYPVSMTLHRNTQLKLLTISLHWHITHSRLPSSYRFPLSRIQAVLEAIGTDLLTFRTAQGQSPIYPVEPTEPRQAE